MENSQIWGEGKTAYEVQNTAIRAPYAERTGESEDSEQIWERATHYASRRCGMLSEYHPSWHPGTVSAT